MKVLGPHRPIPRKCNQNRERKQPVQLFVPRQRVVNKRRVAYRFSL